ncbi:hypothetical protein EJV47_22335 [Hymenobacter gummosus]|uniref:Uncharacterized protein n=1 Tax=Hymenobacter gummosus TaxID=1776032 RepID=A0A431TWZ2_9BACT|nr:hypothetical protein [Hymenobacter gummosus]RTQ46269.1 hypothetical protein EJV47_22335 [Hymenobacter gummosus]
MPENYRDGEFRRHLTKAEKATLRQGGIVDKTHKAYQTVWRDYYDQGPLRVNVGPDGKYHFTPYGEWKRLTRKGRLMADSNPARSFQQGYWREYWPDGSVQSYTYSVPMTVMDGDSVDHTRWVYFAPGNSRDTAYVMHWFPYRHKRTTKDALPSYMSFDAQGKKPVPAGWKPPF